jgi:DNA (cytosine-5)-methyltransferase 1
LAAYYNEIDPYAAQWLRNLIAKGHIAAGEVDERSIEDVRPDDLRGFTQCHFFAGIGVWSYALRLAGWPDDRPVWTGSCPCQPFSAAGKGLGFADERHLWPAWHWLIQERAPAILFGEQVASKDVDPWIDLVFDDLEALGYACGATPFPSAGIGAPHIRDRTYFVADADYARSQGRKRVRERAAERSARSSGVAGIVADAGSERQQGQRLCDGGRTPILEIAGRSEACELADTPSIGRRERGTDALRSGERSSAEGLEQRTGDVRFLGRSEPAGPTNGFWRAADWLLCRDEKWRAVEPGTFPLADGAPSRVGRLRAYGNAINAQAAAEFIRAAREAIE